MHGTNAIYGHPIALGVNNPRTGDILLAYGYEGMELDRAASGVVMMLLCLAHVFSQLSPLERLLSKEGWSCGASMVDFSFRASTADSYIHSPQCQPNPRFPSSTSEMSECLANVRMIEGLRMILTTCQLFFRLSLCNNVKVVSHCEVCMLHFEMLVALYRVNNLSNRSVLERTNSFMHERCYQSSTSRLFSFPQFSRPLKTRLP